jgi:hypothetical protein
MLLVLALLQLAQAPPPAALSFDPPAGWIRSQDPRSGLVMSSPPGLPFGRMVVMTVFSPSCNPLLFLLSFSFSQKRPQPVILSEARGTRA